VCSQHYKDIIEAAAILPGSAHEECVVRLWRSYRYGGDSTAGGSQISIYVECVSADGYKDERMYYSKLL